MNFILETKPDFLYISTNIMRTNGERKSIGLGVMEFQGSEYHGRVKTPHIDQVALVTNGYRVMQNLLKTSSRCDKGAGMPPIFRSR